MSCIDVMADVFIISNEWKVIETYGAGDGHGGVASSRYRTEGFGYGDGRKSEHKLKWIVINDGSGKSSGYGRGTGIGSGVSRWANKIGYGRFR
jgi:hypothetical protein